MQTSPRPGHAVNKNHSTCLLKQYNKHHLAAKRHRDAPSHPSAASAQHQQQVGQQCCTELCSAPAAEMQPLCRQRTAPQRVELGQHRSAHPAPTTRSAGLSVKMQENAYVGCMELSFLCQKMCSWCIHICKCIKCFTSLPNRASRCSSIPTKNSRSRACSIPSSSRNHTPLPGLHRYR